MTDPTNPGDVTITGQRARGPSPFANLQWPTKGNSTGGGDMQTVEENPPPPAPSDEEIQCAIGEGRRQWNADRKAREAIQAFLDKANQLGESGLHNREFGALICELSGGQVVLGPVVAGVPIMDGNGVPIVYPNGRIYVDIDPAGCGNGTPIGYVHSHPYAGVSSGYPSDEDFGFGQRLVNEQNAPHSVGIYTVALMQDPITGELGYQVSRAPLSDRPNAQSQQYQPQWVDPEASPCPPDN